MGFLLHNEDVDDEKHLEKHQDVYELDMAAVGPVSSMDPLDLSGLEVPHNLEEHIQQPAHSSREDIRHPVHRGMELVVQDRQIRHALKEESGALLGHDVVLEIVVPLCLFVSHTV